MMRGMAFLMVVGVLLLAVPAVGAEPAKEAAAVAAAETWLGMVDQGDFAGSWREAAEYFKNSLSQGQWDQALQAARKPLGKLVSRTVKTKTYATSLPGAPDGEYVVIEFQTSFENKKAAIETVTPMMDKDGKWRVSGYFIR